MAAPFQPTRESAIGSPRSRRSVQDGPSTTFTTPVVPGDEYAPTPLHTTDRNVSNVDPMVLASGIAAAQQSPLPESSRNTSSSKRFSSKLSQLAKRAMGKPSIDSPERRAEEGRPSPSGPPLHVASPAGSSSQTIHESDGYEGTTVVSHDNYEASPVAQGIGSPVYVEPKPTNDYAKMESPPHGSIVSFTSYINRVRQFLYELNELPWVAERVTVDYVPGASKDRRRVRVNRLQRPLSWYGDTPHTRRRPSLFSDSTSPTSQLPQTQLPPQDRFSALQTPLLNRSAQQEPPQREVVWEIIDPANPSNAPYVTVVPANWSPHQPVPPDPLQPTVPAQQPQPGPYVPPEPQPTANPPPITPQHPASTWSYPGKTADGFQQFVPRGETFPTGYVPYENVASIEAAYQNRKFHPQPRDPASQNFVPQQSEPGSAATGAGHAGRGEFGMGVPQTARDLDEPFTTSLGQAGGTSLPASSEPTPYNPSTQPPAFPTPRVASGSAVPMPTPGVGPGLANVEATPRATVASLASPGRPPSAAPSRASRTSQRSHGPAPSVRIVQNGNRPPSVAPSHASRATSAAARAMGQTPNRPPSAALSHASRVPSVRASQSRPSPAA